MSTAWPEGKRFAFTIFDDPDAQTVANGRPVYDLLADLGFRTTKAVWPVRGGGIPSDDGETCSEDHYREWAQHLQSLGFEIAYHNTTSHSSTREETERGLEAFAKHFGRFPTSMANHYNCAEAIYFGDKRLGGWRRHVYNALTRGRNRRFRGEVPGDPYFWGDLCRARVTYVRNFVFREVNTLAACPWMPYHDPARPYVAYWFAASRGDDVRGFVEQLGEANQDRLEAEGGACILFVHFGHGFVQDGRVVPRCARLLERLARREGWFVPVVTLLDHLLARRADPVLTDGQRAALERRWLVQKVGGAGSSA
jgi:hypothetical protein